MTGETIPRPVPPGRHAPAEERLGLITGLPLPQQVEAFEGLHRELETRLRASET